MTADPRRPDIDRLDVHVGSAPEPGLIRAAIEAAVAGRHPVPGPEGAVAAAVATAVRAQPTGGQS